MNMRRRAAARAGRARRQVRCSRGHRHRSNVLSGICGTLLLSAAALAGDVPPVFSSHTNTSGIDIVQIPSPLLDLGPVNLSPMIGGGAAGDFNRDGYQDVFIVGCGVNADQLYLNNGDGTFTDHAFEAGLAEPHMGVGVCAGDYDNDGWIDLFVISFGPTADNHPPAPGKQLLWRNNGVQDGVLTFTNMAEEAGVHFTAPSAPDGFGPCFGDYDLDGDLDLYVPHWYAADNRLFRNEGDGTFTNVTIQAGLTGATVRGFSGRFVDMNGDRYPELLVAADYGTSQYYVNNGDGTFSRETESAGVGLDSNGMGHAVGDFNRDGLLDWYVTSIDADIPVPPWIEGTGNMLYLNNGDGTYDEVSGATGTSDGGWGWGTIAMDVNHDGHLDIVETNGWHGFNMDGDPEWTSEQCYLWLNDGVNTPLGFNEIALDCGLSSFSSGRGMIRLDIENDGDQDIVFFANNQRTEVFRNDLPIGFQTRYLRLFFDTSGNDRLAPHGYGTRVVAIAGKDTWVAAMSGGSSFISQSELSVHLGLNEHDAIDELRIEWNDGTVTRLVDVATSQTLTIASGNRNDLDADGSVGVNDLLLLLAAWGDAHSAPDLNADGAVNLSDLLLLLQNWT